MLVVIFENLLLPLALPEIRLAPFSAPSRPASSTRCMRMILAAQRVGSKRKSRYLVIDRRIRSRQALDILRNLYGLFGVTALGSQG